LLADNENHVLMLINCWILDHVSSCFFNKPFIDLSTLALKCEHAKFHSLTETTKTEKSRDWYGSDWIGQTYKSCSSRVKIGGHHKPLPTHLTTKVYLLCHNQWFILLL